MSFLASQLTYLQNPIIKVLEKHTKVAYLYKKTERVISWEQNSSREQENLFE